MHYKITCHWKDGEERKEGVVDKGVMTRPENTHTHTGGHSILFSFPHLFLSEHACMCKRLSEKDWKVVTVKFNHYHLILLPIFSLQPSMSKKTNAYYDILQ